MDTLLLALPEGVHIACKAVLFDMDGVLVDSLATIERHLREWATAHDLDTQHVVDISPGRTNAELVADVAPHLDAYTEAQQLIKREIVETTGITACPGAARLICQLPGAAWAVVTSGHRPVALSRLGAANLPIPEVLITADDVRVGKPDPEGYRKAADRLGVHPRDCVVIEDATAGLYAADAAGMRSIAISDGKGGPEGPKAYILASLTLLKIHPTGHIPAHDAV